MSDVVSLEISVQSDHRWAASKNPTTWSWLEISKHLRIKATTNNTTSARRTKLRRHHNYSKCIASSARTCSHGPCAAYGRRSSHSVPSTAGVTSVIAMSFCVLLYVKCRPWRKRPLSTQKQQLSQVRTHTHAKLLENAQCMFVRNISTLLGTRNIATIMTKADYQVQQYVCAQCGSEYRHINTTRKVCIQYTHHTYAGDYKENLQRSPSYWLTLMLKAGVRRPRDLNAGERCRVCACAAALSARRCWCCCRTTDVARCCDFWIVTTESNLK